MRHSVSRLAENEYESFAESFSNYDVIDTRIDVSAQKALIRLKGNPATSADAAQMLAAVKGGQLQGIFGDDLRAAAQLAARLGTVRWELVPPGRVAALVREPNPYAPPTIIFRTQYRGDRYRLDPALVAAWRGFVNPSAYGAEMEDYIAPRRRSPAEYLVPPDDRVLVTDTLEIPARFICCLEFMFLNPTTKEPLPFRGSGTLISDRHVLTAAHNVLVDMSQSNPNFPISYVYPDRMYVAPARNDRDFPGHSSEVKTARVSPVWKATAERQRAAGNVAHIEPPKQADYALLTLSEPLGTREPFLPPTPMQLNPPPLGHWGHPKFGGNTRIRAYDNSLWYKLRNETLNVSGYPGDKCRTKPRSGSATRDELIACIDEVPDIWPFLDWGSTQWRSHAKIIKPFDLSGLLSYELDTMPGHSGSPVWLNWEGYRNLVAIHTWQLDGLTTAGVRITEPLLQQLRYWMHSLDGVQPTF